LSLYQTRLKMSVLGLTLVTFCTLPLLAQKSSKTEEPPEEILHPIPFFPEELLIPPEQPVEKHPFFYIGYAQTTQGVLQDDPLDRDLLIPRKGWTDWKTAYKPPEGYFGYSVPTFEALIQMVTDRDTYVLGATPFDPQANPNGENAFEHLEKITFEYQSKYRSYSNLFPRVTIYLNGNQIADYFLDAVPIRNQGGYLGTETIEKVQFSIKPIHQATIPSFKFSRPGDYLVRVEFTERAINQAGAVEMRRTGIALDVYGKVVKTNAPSATLIPVYPSSASQSQRQDLRSDIEGRAAAIKTSLQALLPVSNTQSYPLEVSKFSIDGAQFNDLYHMAQVFLRAKRFSDPNYRSDRFVAVVEWDLYNRLLAGGNIFTHPVFLCSAGFNWAKHFMVVPGVEFQAPFTRPAFRTLEHDAVHEMFHTLSSVPWAPIDGKMGDCDIPPFHDAASGGVAFGIASGGLPDALFAGKNCIMQAGADHSHISQCTYRHALDVLSRSEIDPPVIMVSGIATRNGLTKEVTLNPLYQMDGFYELEEGGAGDWHILLKDELGSILGDYPFDPLFQDGQLEESVPFNFTVPDLPGVQRVEITAPMVAIGGPFQQVLDAVDYSTFPPVIWDLVADKTPGQVEVRWAAYDFDGDPLHYTLLASEDGLTYFPTPVSEGPQTEAVFEVPDSLSHLKLVVTDGTRSVSRVLMF